MGKDTMDKEERQRVRDFFGALFQETRGYVEIRTIDSKGYVLQDYFPTADINRLLTHIADSTLNRFKDADIYFGVCPRRRKQGKEEDVAQVGSLWVDLDCNDVNERTDALKKLGRFPVPPSIIVSSGNGLHAYWLLKPYSINSKDGKRRVKGYLKGLALALGADRAFDLSRVLRVPGTRNLKDPHNPLPVAILESHQARRYDLTDFEEYKVDVEDARAELDVVLDTIPDRFWRILEDDAKLKATWEGKRSDLKDKTRSGYDMALAHQLMPYEFRDGEVAAILRASPSGKGKDATRQYLSLTIGKAKKKLERGKRKNDESKKVKNDSNRMRKTTQGKRNTKTKTLIPGLIHLVKDGDAVKYLLKTEAGLCIEETFALDREVYRPKQDLPIKMPGPDIIEEPMEIDTTALLDRVIDFIRSYLELPHESDYLILALWVLHTYLIEKFSATPILYFYGVKETGKSRAGEVLAELAFWCERLTSPTEATLFREAHYFRIALVIDEIRLWGREGNKDLALLINSRYKRGISVPRVNMNVKGGEDQIEYFDVFGPLAICTTEGIPDTLESRSITFLMQKNAKAEVEKVIDEVWARSLRNVLTIFRAKHLDQDLEETEQVARRRLNEIMMPLYQILMLVCPKREKEFKETVKQIEKTREEEEGLSLEAEIVEKILEYHRINGDQSFLTTDIAERLNEERNEKERISDRLVSMRLARLGFQKTRLTNGRRGFLMDSGLLKRLALQYGIDMDGSGGSS